MRNRRPSQGGPQPESRFCLCSGKEKIHRQRCKNDPSFPVSNLTFLRCGPGSPAGNKGELCSSAQAWVAVQVTRYRITNHYNDNIGRSVLSCNMSCNGSSPWDAGNRPEIIWKAQLVPVAWVRLTSISCKGIGELQQLSHQHDFAIGQMYQFVNKVQPISFPFTDVEAKSLKTKSQISSFHLRLLAFKRGLERHAHSVHLSLKIYNHLHIELPYQ